MSPIEEKLLLNQASILLGLAAILEKLQLREDESRIMKRVTDTVAYVKKAQKS